MTDLSLRQRVSYAGRVAIAYALHYSGLLALIRRARLRGKAVVLMYHRVLTEDEAGRTASQPGMVVAQATFARHLAILTRHFRILTLDEFADHLRRRVPFDRPSCLITFDDGWIDNLHNAVPLMQRHAVPSAIFLPVHFIGGRRLFTREALTHLLVQVAAAVRQSPARRETFRRLLEPLGLAPALDLDEARALPGAMHLLGAHRYANGPEFEALAADLSRELGVEAADVATGDTFIDWHQVADMGERGVTFGGHGADHRVLTQVPPDVVEFEVATSKTVLDARLPSPVRSFAYPNGGWNAAVARTVRACGYDCAFTIEPGHVACDDDPMALRRMTMHDDMTRLPPMFMARLAGVF